MRMTGITRAQRKTHLLQYLLLTIGALAMLFPFLWMVSTSFKLRGEIFDFLPVFWPKEFTFQNYVNAFQNLDLGRLYWNTAVVAVSKTLLQVYTSALLGYVFGKFRFWGRDYFFYLILLTMIIPLEVYVIPLYQMMVGAKMGDNHLALIVPYLFSAYAMFLFRQFMFTIPNDLMDAARIQQGVCDRFILLSGGRMCGEGTLDELTALAASRGASSPSDLEEVFLALT